MTDIAPPRLDPPVSARDHAFGPVDTPTLLIYGDYECPYTRQAYHAVARVRADLGDRFRFVFRHFPLDAIHPHARQAAEAAVAAAAQDRFWQMHDLLFHHQKALELDDLRGYAEELGLDLARFDRDLTEHTHAARLDDDLASGDRGGVEGTPTLFLNGHPYARSYDAETLRAVLAAARQHRNPRCEAPPVRLGARPSTSARSQTSGASPPSLSLRWPSWRSSGRSGPRRAARISPGRRQGDVPGAVATAVAFGSGVLFGTVR
jgi:2-hydroxychromene-2-carboxylate isomerase